jgi:hypothetical protein
MWWNFSHSLCSDWNKYYIYSKGKKNSIYQIIDLNNYGLRFRIFELCQMFFMRFLSNNIEMLWLNTLYKTGHWHYLPTYQILMISDNVEFLPPIFMPCFGSHFENGRHLENFENAELLLTFYYIVLYITMVILRSLFLQRIRDVQCYIRTVSDYQLT